MAISELLAGFAEILQNVMSVSQICFFILFLQLFSNTKLFLVCIFHYSAACTVLSFRKYKLCIYIKMQGDNFVCSIIL